MEKLVLHSLRGNVTRDVPIWLMRQAGRYLPEYRDLRAKAGSFMALCFHPEHAAEVTLQPLRRFALDAAILFSDILVIPHALGRTLTFVEGEGPRLPPIQNADDVERLKNQNIHAVLAPIYETVRLVRAGLDQDKTLIGFAGSPFTIACYMIDGQGGGFPRARAFAAEQPKAFAALLDIISDATAEYLIWQVRAGADCVQLFDSWAGLCGDVENHIHAPTKKIIDAFRASCPGVPVIGFPRQIQNYAEYAAKTDVDAIGLDPAARFDVLPKNICAQGNLDPEILLKGGRDMTDAAARILEDSRGRPFIFNLGHGIIKETPIDHVAALVRQVKEFKR